MRARSEELQCQTQSPHKADRLKADIRRLEGARENLLGVMESGKVSDTAVIARRFEAIQQDLARAKKSLRKQSKMNRETVTPDAIRRKLQTVVSDLRKLRRLPDQESFEERARPLLQRIIGEISVEPHGRAAQITPNWDVVLGLEHSTPTPRRCSS